MYPVSASALASAIIAAGCASTVDAGFASEPAAPIYEKPPVDVASPVESAATAKAGAMAESAGLNRLLCGGMVDARHAEIDIVNEAGCDSRRGLSEIPVG